MALLEVNMDKNEHNSNMKDKFKFTKKDILRAVAIALVLTTVFFAGFFTHYFITPLKKSAEVYGHTDLLRHTNTTA